jgi:hypothetical protein
MARVPRRAAAVLLIHGDQDPMIPFDAMFMAAEALAGRRSRRSGICRSASAMGSTRRACGRRTFPAKAFATEGAGRFAFDGVGWPLAAAGRDVVRAVPSAASIQKQLALVGPGGGRPATGRALFARAFSEA